MTTIKLYCHGSMARAKVEGQLTHAMAGIPVEIQWDEVWNGLTKTMKIRCNDVCRTAIVAEDGTAVVPYECLIAGQRLEIGLDGWSQDGTLRIPSSWASCGIVKQSVAQCDGPEGAPPTVDTVAQLQILVGKAEEAAAGAAELVGKIPDYQTQINNLDTGKVSKEEGKGLSSNDYDNAAKQKVDAIPEDPKYTDTVYDDTEVKDGLDQLRDGKLDQTTGTWPEWTEAERAKAREKIAAAGEMVETSTEKAYRHDDVTKPKMITITQDERFPTAPRIFYSRNRWPRMRYWNRDMPFLGMTVKTDGDAAEISGTTGSTTGEFQVKPTEDGDVYYPLEELGLAVGERVRLYLFSGVTAARFHPKVRFYDADKNYIKQVQAIATVGVSEASSSTTIPDGTAFVVFQLAFIDKNTEYAEHIIPVLVKDSDPADKSQTFTDGQVTVQTNIAASGMTIVPHKAVVAYDLPLKEYIDKNSSANGKIDMTDIRKERSFVTPEMFGAIGNGKNDDTAAVQACIDYALANRACAFGGNSYKLSQPLKINGDSAYVRLNYLIYSGDDAAVIYSGSSSNISINAIWCSAGGAGFRIASDIASNLNNIRIGSIYLNGNDCIQLCVTKNDIWGNRIVFESLQAGNGFACIHNEFDAYRAEDLVSSSTGSNTFIGGKCGRGLWAVQYVGSNDNYLTIQMEGVRNGIVTNGKRCRIIAPRCSELVGASFDETAEGFPRIADSGILLRVRQKDGTIMDGADIRACSIAGLDSESIYPTSIDLSQAHIAYHDTKNNTDLTIYKNYPPYTVIRSKLNHRRGYHLADSFILFGRHILIKEPVFPQTATVTAADSGYAGDYSVTDNDDEFIIYEKFIVTETGCDYTLPPSYDQIAFRRFKIVQQEGADAIFRDWRGTVIFEGSRYGAGTYTLEARCAEGGFWADDWNNSGQVWDVYRGDELIDTYLPVTA